MGSRKGVGRPFADPVSVGPLSLLFYDLHLPCQDLLAPGDFGRFGHGRIRTSRLNSACCGVLSRDGVPADYAVFIVLRQACKLSFWGGAVLELSWVWLVPCVPGGDLVWLAKSGQVQCVP